MGCGASTSHTQPPPSPGGAAPIIPPGVADPDANIVEKFVEPVSPVVSGKPQIQAGLIAPAAEEGGFAKPSPAIVIPQAAPDAMDIVEPFQNSPKAGPVIPQAPPVKRPDSARSQVSVKSRPGSAGSARPASAQRRDDERPGTAKDRKDRPGSAGKNREDRVPHKVWLTDKRKIESVDSIKDAEKKLDKDIFRNGSPKKKGSAKKAKMRRSVAEDPGPCRPTTAKQRDGRPSSAERNRHEQVKPSVWLDHISRDGKSTGTGSRSFIECTPNKRPNSADRKRKSVKSEKKKSKNRTSGTNSNRPSSAERSRGELINNAVWLEDKAGGGDKEGQGAQIERPSSAGRRRTNAAVDNNGKNVDQNGRPRSAEKERGLDLAPLKGVTPMKKPTKAAEV